MNGVEEEEAMPAVQQARQEPAAGTQPVQREENTVFVGRKDAMSYVMAVVTRFNQGAAEVRLKARGKAISRAADVTQITKNRFLPTLQIRGVRFSTEEMQSEDGSVKRVTSMEVVLSK